MAAGEEIRVGVRLSEDYRVETGRNGGGRDDPNGFAPQPVPGMREPRAVGSPLPMGSSTKMQASARPEGQPGRASVPPPGRALSAPTSSDPDASSGMQWFAGVLKQALPFVQKLLPLLDGQIASAAANLLTARPHTPPPPRLDLQPIENGLADLQLQQANFRDQLSDQNTTLKRVEDQLESVREATDRNTLEQQELIEDLKSITGKVNLLALLFLGLLVISIILNIFLFLHIQRVLP
jgi:hypothetical protein